MIKVYVKEDGDRKKAQAFSEKYGYEMLRGVTPGEEELYLCFGKEAVSLQKGNQSMTGDFTSMLPRLKINNLNGEMLVKAAKFKTPIEHPLAVDATAGMGEDSLLLAAAGYRVKMLERNPVVATLLEDTIKRARNDERLAEIASRMEVFAGDSIDYLYKMDETPDIVYLDPMFPGRTKSGLVKKKFQLIHYLEAPCEEESKLLDAAIEAAPKRIIIKRPSKGPYLAEKKPSYSISGKTVRYDCIVL